MYILKKVSQSTMIFVFIYQLSCYLGNYIFSVLYNDLCVSFWSYNSPLCLLILTCLGGISLLYTYIWYIFACTIFILVIRHISNFTDKV